MKVNILKLIDPAFPAMLTNIDRPPKQLYWLGAELKDWLQRPKVAIVGSRKVSPYGREVTRLLAGELAKRGVIIISGLAFGVDSIAHQATLEHGGTTIAVLPTSLERIYPASHAGLAQRIINSGGTLISESGPTEPIYKSNFTYRNRLISGLADGVLITEAASRSGSLTTARYGLEQGKVVMAVPGNITAAGSEGTNQLIKTGALPITSADDVLFALGISPSQAQVSRFRGSSEEETLLELIAQGVNDQEELALHLKIDGGQLGSLLVGLEISGQIRPAGGGQWIKA